MKQILIIFAILLSNNISFAQSEESTARKFINAAQFKQINKDWTVIAEFYSGLNEYVKFYPIEVINLKTGEKIKALQLDMLVKYKEGTADRSIFKTAWVGLDEIDEFIYFLEKHVTPNLDLKFKKKSTEYYFSAKEMTFSYLVDEKDKRISIIMNSYEKVEKEGIPNYYFWTETQVDKIPQLLQVLKRLMEK